MKKSLFTLSLSLFLLSSCKNETVNFNEGVDSDGKIRFAAGITKSTTRSATDNPLVSTADLQAKVGQFNVFAYPAGGTTALINNAEVKWNGLSWEFTGPYWPKSKVDFYAYANWGTHTVPVINETGITAAAITVAEDVLGATGQKDLLVSAALDQEKALRTNLTFKHALTQVIFKAGNIDPTHLDVRIGGLRIVNVATTGDMKFLKATPVANSDIKWDNHSAKTGVYHVQGLQVTGKTAFDAANNVASNSIEVDNMENKAFSDYKQLNSAATNNAQILIPQEFTGWNPNDGKPILSQSAYIELLAIVNATGHRSGAAAADPAFYYCGTPGAGANGIGDTYGRIFIPIHSIAGDASQWVSGKAVKYIITFGDKESGSGGGGYDENGDPVLVPIKFTATVDNWTEVEVPLLSANFEATSTDIKSPLVNGFTTSFIKDVEAAKEAKTFKAKITIKGTLLDNMTISYAPSATAETKMLVNSTVEYNFAGVTTWTASKTISMTVPTGWQAQAFKGAATVGSVIAAGNAITINGTTATSFILTKK